MIHLTRLDLADPAAWALFRALMADYLREVCPPEEYAQELADLDDPALNAELLTQCRRDHDPYFVMAIQQDGRCVGLITYTFLTDQRAGFINNFYMDGPLRGQGLGSQAYDLAEDHLRRLGALRIRLEPEDRARSFYLRKGYAPVSGNTFVKSLS